MQKEINRKGHIDRASKRYRNIQRQIEKDREIQRERQIERDREIDMYEQNNIDRTYSDREIEREIR